MGKKWSPTGSAFRGGPAVTGYGPHLAGLSSVDKARWCKAARAELAIARHIARVMRDLEAAGKGRPVGSGRKPRS